MLHSFPNVDDLQAALDRLEHPIKLESKFKLEKEGGLLPIYFEGKKLAIEYYVEEVNREFVRHYPSISKLDLNNMKMYIFTTHDELEYALANYVASVLVSHFSGLVFDPQGGRFINYDELIETARLYKTMATKEQIEPGNMDLLLRPYDIDLIVIDIRLFENYFTVFTCDQLKENCAFKILQELGADSMEKEKNKITYEHGLLNKVKQFIVKDRPVSINISGDSKIVEAKLTELAELSEKSNIEISKSPSLENYLNRNITIH